MDKDKGANNTRRKSKRSIDQVEEVEEREEKRSKMEETLAKILLTMEENKHEMKKLREGQEGMRGEVKSKFDEVFQEVASVGDRVDGVEDRMMSLSERVLKIERNAGGSGQNQIADTKRDEQYWIARRSIRMGPTEAKSKLEAEAFVRGEMVTTLGMQQWEVDSYDFEEVSLVVRKNRATKTDITLVDITFKQVTHRDRVFSRSINIGSRDLRLEMVVPNRLIPVFKKMEKRAYDLRKGGRKTMIRFFDERLTLQLLSKPKTPGSIWSVQKDVELVELETEQQQ